MGVKVLGEGLHVIEAADEQPVGDLGTLGGVEGQIGHSSSDRCGVESLAGARSSTTGTGREVRVSTGQSRPDWCRSGSGQEGGSRLVGRIFANFSNVQIRGRFISQLPNSAHTGSEFCTRDPEDLAPTALRGAPSSPTGAVGATTAGARLHPGSTRLRRIESAGRTKSTHTRPGNPYLKAVLGTEGNERGPQQGQLPRRPADLLPRESSSQPVTGASHERVPAPRDGLLHWSVPGPPSFRFRPEPPSSLSFPLPPTNRSLPARPLMTSSPARPSIVLLRRSPSRTSFWSVPMTFSMEVIRLMESASTGQPS